MPVLDYIIITLICLIIICMYPLLTTDRYGDKPKVYSIGYIIIFVALAFVPYFNLFLGITLLIVYVMSRAFGDLKLKHNKFTKKWFGVSD